MKTSNTSAETLMIACLLAPFIYLALIWNQLPAEIATHYSLDGRANGWMMKENAALIMAGFSVALCLVLRYLPQFDPKASRQPSNFNRLRAVITVGFAAVTGWLWYEAGHQDNADQGQTFLLALVGLMLAGMGNYLTTVKPNWFIGIRTPWTLESETVWRKTHRLGGRIMVAGGLLIALLVFIVPVPYQVGVMVMISLLSSLIPLIYSYIFFRREKKSSFAS